MEVREESEKAGLKLSIQKPKIMTPSPIASWQIDGETMETERDFIFLGSKITADGDCSHELFFKFIYFNWRLITLQYCIGFAIHQHVSGTGIHVFPILNPPSSLLPPHTIPLGRCSLEEKL